MKVVQITSRYGSGSIGKISKAVSGLLTENGIENYILYSWGETAADNAIRCSKDGRSFYDSLIAKLTGYYGFCSKGNTARIIKALEEIKPDVVQIHNIHAHNCNVKILFDYLREKKIRVFFTFHDCWAFTGYCMYFDAVNCTKWRSSCGNCPQKKKFSWLFDRSSRLQQMKIDALQNLDLTIITPSQWLANLTHETFLKEYPIKVINNGIDLNIFKPTPSCFRQMYKLENKLILLGIASKWEVRKGLDTFIKLSKQLDENYQIVLVGTTPEIDKMLPSNIISIHRTEGQKQLAEIYTAADVLVNPTMEENFPTVNIESIACGTPVITYKTGGSSEMLDSLSGVAIDRGDYKALLHAIKSIKHKESQTIEHCVTRSKMYCQKEKFQEYIDLYHL